MKIWKSVLVFSQTASIGASIPSKNQPQGRPPRTDEHKTEKSTHPLDHDYQDTRKCLMITDTSTMSVKYRIEDNSTYYNTIPTVTKRPQSITLNKQRP